uniref:Uncharacterized protein n=1 Tax=Chrysemys picta bellii TaxID=8478 RepID=A0A8C3HGN5_CHRPI
MAFQFNFSIEEKAGNELETLGDTALQLESAQASLNPGGSTEKSKEISSEENVVVFHLHWEHDTKENPRCVLLMKRCL